MKVAVAIAVVCAARAAAAAPHKVFVLPLDGNADKALRAQLAGDVRDLARAEGDDVSAGDATFSETAAAVGCQPDKPACVDQVIGTLGVDELVWGTATTANGETSVVIRRARKGTPARSASVTLKSGRRSDDAKPGLAPLFGQAATPASGGETASSTTTTSTSVASGPAPVEDRRDRNIGLGLVAGGATLLAVSFVLWANTQSTQSQVNSAPTATSSDIQALIALENRAANYALAGNFLFVVGLAAGGAGAYYLWRDRKHRATTIAPTASEHGAGVMMRGVW